MKKYAAIGHPISHSLSPKMFNAAFSDQNINATFEVREVLPENLVEFISNLRKEKFYNGLSVTIPHKEKIIPLLDFVSEESKKIGAVNTVYWKENILCGENTDWKGVVSALQPIQSIVNKKVFIFGAGGAARACVYALKSLGVEKIYVWDRNLEKAEKVAFDESVQVGDMKNINADIFINATPLGLKEEDVIPISDEKLKSFEWVFDVVYGETNLLKRARDVGCKTIDGREMLLAQAALQFKIFFGIDAPVEIIRKSIFNS